MNRKKQQIVDIAGQLLFQEGLGSIAQVQVLRGDGSQRQFFRISLDNGSSVVAVAPGKSPFSRSEALSAWHIGSHLRKGQIPVPNPLAFDRESGLILFEDLGDTRLHDLACQDTSQHGENLFDFYRAAVRELVKMQFRGADGFEQSWCWQTGIYDRELMLERESGYFLHSLCRDYCGLRFDPDPLHNEFMAIADAAAQAPPVYFLHRDFQSRNIMIKEGQVRFIDFQGGRLGPLAYDLASLLIDPYVSLPADFQERLVDEYLACLDQYASYDPVVFRREYHYLCLQRNLQVLGAFAFLSGQREKIFFRQFIRPSLLLLSERLSRGQGRELPVLAGVVDTCLEALDR